MYITGPVYYYMQIMRVCGESYVQHLIIYDVHVYTIMALDPTRVRGIPG